MAGCRTAPGCALIQVSRLVYFDGSSVKPRGSSRLSSVDDDDDDDDVVAVVVVLVEAVLADWAVVDVEDDKDGKEVKVVKDDTTCELPSNSNSCRKVMADSECIVGTCSGSFMVKRSDTVVMV